MGAVDYRYELRDGDEVVATGHLTREQPLQLGDRVELAGQWAVVIDVLPLLGAREQRVVLDRAA